MNKALLPSGLSDLLPPLARQETHILSQLLSTFESFGYEQVTPPLVEFEETLLSGTNETVAGQAFRVMDPLSRSMLAFRPDMTMQVARIAATRLGDAPRPLRLSYAGPTLRVKAESTGSERQLSQAGIELIGISTPDADAEIILVALEALERLGLTGVTVDLNLPGLLALLLEGEDAKAEEKDALLKIILSKDMSALAKTRWKSRETMAALIEAAGPVETALKTMESLKLPEAARTQCRDLQEVARMVKRSAPNATVTVDPIESRGFAYHQGIGFSMFLSGLTRELGRGGRYRASGVDATGFTLYTATLMQALKAPHTRRRVLVARDVAAKESRALREEGYATVHALSDADLREEARRLNCHYVYENGAIAEV